MMAARDDQWVGPLNEVPSLNAVLRALKREESSLFNCICSILDDAQFVEQVVRLYPSLPVFPNLRCGLWYVKPPIRDTCYFKSTDGHNGNWSFSTTRLNLHVAQAAAAAGGCLIVDATKRGKRFPDALSKTVPIWAAVLNRAVQRLRQRSPRPDATAAAAAGEGGGGGQAAAVEAAPCCNAWDGEVHLPPWVSANEANSICRLLDGWVDSLLEVGADLSALSATLRKPLRCLWVGQGSCLGEQAGRDLQSLPFTPIVLVGASATQSRQRRCLSLPPATPSEPPLNPTYCYFPGAADDEEKWACGLTPELMWRHTRALLAAGPARVEALTRRLVAEQRRRQEEDGGALGPPEGHLHAGQQGSDAPHAAAGGSAQQPLAVPPAQAAGCPATPNGGLPAQQAPGQPLHLLLPQGCLPTQAAAVQRLGAGIYLVGSTGLAVGSAAAAAAPAVWQLVDAVLHVGTLPLAGMQDERQPGSLPQPEQQGQQQEQGSDCGGQAEQQTGARAPPAACRYCWLPVRSSKVERRSLQRQLAPALRFAGAQLARGRRLLLSCDDGLDASVCVAVACLLAFYRLEAQPGSGGSAGPNMTLALPSSPSGGSGSGSPRRFPPMLGAAGFTKLSVRQHLAAVSAHYPGARPTRASLRQVFNFFLAQLEGGGGGNSSEPDA